MDFFKAREQGEGTRRETNKNKNKGTLPLVIMFMIQRTPDSSCFAG